MSASPPARSALAAAIVLLGAASSRAAGAAEPDAGLEAELTWASPGAHWYVETVGASCEPQRRAFEREIALACGAVGGTCLLAPSLKGAEFRAILDCSGPSESWTLETRTIDGTPLGKIDLAGAPDDRLREAAVEVAREPAPDRGLVVETAHATLAKETPAHRELGAESLTLVIGGRATTTNTRSQPTMGGAHVQGALPLGRGAFGTLGMAGEAGGAEDKATRAFRGGPGIALGAPFDATAPIGAAAEAGLAAVHKYGPPTGADGTGVLTTNTAFAAYVQTTWTLQWPRAGLRPYAALSVALMSEGPTDLFASGEAGLALSIF